MKLELMSTGLTLIGWIAVLLWLINFLFAHHDQIKQSFIMKSIGWLGLLLILIGGGVNYASSINDNPNDNAPNTSNIKTHTSDPKQ